MTLEEADVRGGGGTSDTAPPHPVTPRERAVARAAYARGLRDALMGFRDTYAMERARTVYPEEEQGS